MSLGKKLISAILATSMSFMSFATTSAMAVDDEKNVYLYDSTLSTKSKEVESEEDKPFNVFDIYDAYYEMVSNPVVTTKTTTKVTTKATTSVAKTTSATKKSTTSTKTKTTTSSTESKTTTTSATTTAVSTTKVTTTQLGQFPNGEYINGIDVSQWQYKIDWNAVKNSGQVDFAIIKAGWGKEYDQVDPFFRTNMEQAQAAGMDVGVYWFSYAMSVEEAKQEALVCLETIKDFSFNYPIYYDFEYYTALNTLSTATLSEMIEVFCTTLQEHGYYTGVYGSGSDFQYRIYRHVLDKYPVWVAEYDTPTLTWYDGTHGIWQYSPRGRIDGISTDVDLNYCYVDYPKIIGVNPKGGKLPETTVPTTSTTAKITTTTTTSNTNTTEKSDITTSTTTVMDTTTTTIRLNGKIIDLDTTVNYNWADFDKDKYSFAMIRAEKSEIGLIGKNVDLAHENGINCGVIYDYKGISTSGISDDAVAIDEQLTGRKLDYPLYFGISESSNYYGMFGFEKNNASAVAEEFCSYFESKKYYVGIMAEDKALVYNYNKNIVNRFDVWQIKYNNDPSLFTNKCGITTRYNRETGELQTVATRDYPDIMSKNGLNGYEKVQEEVK